MRFVRSSHPKKVISTPAQTTQLNFTRAQRQNARRGIYIPSIHVAVVLLDMVLSARAIVSACDGSRDGPTDMSYGINAYLKH